jgi:hypothetical protein
MTRNKFHLNDFTLIMDVGVNNIQYALLIYLSIYITDVFLFLIQIYW